MSDILRPQDLAAGQRVLVRHTASGTSLQGKILRVENDGWFTVVIRRDGAADDDGPLSITFGPQSTSWTFYRLPEAAGQGAPSGGRRRRKTRRRKTRKSRK